MDPTDRLVVETPHEILVSDNEQIIWFECGELSSVCRIQTNTVSIWGCRFGDSAHVLLIDINKTSLPGVILHKLIKANMQEVTNTIAFISNLKIENRCWLN